MSFDLDFRRWFFRSAPNSLSVKTAAATKAWRRSVLVPVFRVCVPPSKKKKQSKQIGASTVIPRQKADLDLTASKSGENSKLKPLMTYEHEQHCTANNDEGNRVVELVAVSLAHNSATLNHGQI